MMELSYRLLTWLDVQRVLLRETHHGLSLPDQVKRMSCDSDALEIEIPAGATDVKEAVKQQLKNWFKAWYVDNDNGGVIQLDINDGKLPIEFIDSSDPILPRRTIRPFWEDVAYLNGSELSSRFQLLPNPFQPSSPHLIAFYSFKGGVGRTLHMAAYLIALIQEANRSSRPIKALMIDADLEAPGLTYWRDLNDQPISFSFLDFLEAYHYAQGDRDETMKFMAKEVRKSMKTFEHSTLFFLPACLSDHQLLDTPVLPEHIARGAGHSWGLSEAIFQLGSTLGVDFILIDLRAGLSEISSPMLFDPRIQRFVVTTAVEQSIKGTKLVLEQMSHLAPKQQDVLSGQYYDPVIIMSFLTEESKSLQSFYDTLNLLRESYIQTDDQEDVLTLSIIETDFAQELLYINSWREAESKLASTVMMNTALTWAKSQLEPIDLSHLPVPETDPDPQLKEAMKLRAVCQQYEFAENGEGEDLLVTDPLKNLAIAFQDDLPMAVSIGAKGAGKTFNYVQLSRLKYWEEFVKRLLGSAAEQPKHQSPIFPFLQSRSLKRKASEIVNRSRQTILDMTEQSFLPSEVNDRIRHALDQNLSELDWTQFWIKEIARVIGLDPSETVSVVTIDQALKQKAIRVVFMFDGLEDLFSEAAVNSSHQVALKTLITLPARLTELRDSSLGLIIFLRRDFLQYAMTQNSAQFENLYRSYSLSWDPDSFLKLVYWICTQAEIINTQKDNVVALNRGDLLSRLEQLWGKKLGSPTSNEAYSANWIFSALTDFQGRLQARDIVRFLYHAADIAVERKDEIQFDRWSRSRLLPPQAIRRALEPCSQKKVKEAKEEYPDFRLWFERIEQHYPTNERLVPFQPEDYQISPTELKMLKEMGVVYEDTDKNKTQFYMPEVFRAGLGFSLEKAARPRVVMLKRRAIGTNLL